MKNLFFAMLAMAVILSCESELDNQNPDPLETLSTKATFNLLSDAQTDQAAQVIRLENDLAFRFFDFEKRLIAYVNTTASEILCEGERIREVNTLQQILLNEDDGDPRELWLLRGDDVSVTVYDFDELIMSNCTLIPSLEPIFEGIGDFTWRDNDANPDQDGTGVNTNTWSFNLNGEGIQIRFKGLYNPLTEEISTNTTISLRD